MCQCSCHSRHNRSGAAAAGVLPERLAPFLALVEALPPAVAEPLLTELIARLVEP